MIARCQVVSRHGMLTGRVSYPGEGMLETRRVNQARGVALPSRAMPAPKTRLDLSITHSIQLRLQPAATL